MEGCGPGTGQVDVACDQSGWDSACPSEPRGVEHPTGLRFMATLEVGLSLGESGDPVGQNQFFLNTHEDQGEVLENSMSKKPAQARWNAVSIHPRQIQQFLPTSRADGRDAPHPPAYVCKSVAGERGGPHHGDKVRRMVVNQNAGPLCPCRPIPDGRGRRETREEFPYCIPYTRETETRQHRVRA